MQLPLQTRKRHKSAAVSVQGQATAELVSCEWPPSTHSKVRLGFPSAMRVDSLQLRDVFLRDCGEGSLTEIFDVRVEPSRSPVRRVIATEQSQAAEEQKRSILGTLVGFCAMCAVHRPRQLLSKLDCPESPMACDPAGALHPTSSQFRGNAFNGVVFNSVLTDHFRAVIG